MVDKKYLFILTLTQRSYTGIKHDCVGDKRCVILIICRKPERDQIKSKTERFDALNQHNVPITDSFQ